MNECMCLCTSLCMCTLPLVSLCPGTEAPGGKLIYSCGPREDCTSSSSFGMVQYPEHRPVETRVHGGADILQILCSLQLVDTHKLPCSTFHVYSLRKHVKTSQNRSVLENVRLQNFGLTDDLTTCNFQTLHQVHSVPHLEICESNRVLIYTVYKYLCKRHKKTYRSILSCCYNSMTPN